MKQHLHMSIGPVQGFVSQSRRTRDLWGSSYILSFLSAHAMSGARRADRMIIRPRVDDDPLLRWVEGQRQGDPPRLGSLPNQFTVELLAEDSAEHIAAKAIESFHAAWQQVCRAVWERFVSHALAQGNATETIWRRQIDGFWELIWVAGMPDDDGLLAQRKLWRTHWLPEEPGDKCAVMPDLQELSGWVRAVDRLQRVRQDEFWSAIRSRLGRLDLGDDERLSSVALVKRLYPRIAEEALGWPLETDQLDVTHWPSTVDVAAEPWCRRVLTAAPKQGNAYADGVARAARDHTRTGGVSSLIEVVPTEAAQFAHLDANWFHLAFVSSQKQAPLKDEDVRPHLVQQLKDLAAFEDAKGALGAPPIYFALLLADGDHLGRIVKSLGSDIVSAGLADFTRQVPNTVRAHHGVTVYAGGDDVLALLPVEGALECAHALEQVYRGAFDIRMKKNGGEHGATLSASIVFAHARAPLSLVLAEAHRLLDVVAKEENNRASLAVGIHRSGGSAAEWVTTWRRASADGTERDAVECALNTAREIESGNLSGALLQDVRHTLGLLCGESSMAPGTFSKLLPGMDPSAFLRAEVEHRLAHQDRASSESDAGRLAELLVSLLRRSKADKQSKANEGVSLYIGLDGLMLASFLAGGGREEEHLS
jgi:CRISPR-associated protein Cmr2